MKRRWIALFRGINVGGKNLLPMSGLVAELNSLGLENVRTYIQSGNVVFDSGNTSLANLSKKISKRIDEKFGFSPKVLILSASELQTAIDQNPFAEAVTEPKSLHFYFLEKPPSEPNLSAMADAKSSTERFELTGNLFYLHTPDGVGNSKLAASAERHLGVIATARNYRTVEKLAELASQD